MKLVSTRNIDAVTSVDAAILRGLAADGGLFVPDRMPEGPASDNLAEENFPALAAHIMAPFFKGSALEAHLPAICASAFDFPAPLREASCDAHDFTLLELFHGPTAAFKDFGARFLIRCLEKLTDGAHKKPMVLAATSGDTGGAVAAAVSGAGLSAGVLFPKGGVSPLQERQLCCWPANVRSVRVDGDFDTCQALVKRAFADEDLRRRRPLSSANSINIARLLAQMSYYWSASLDYVRAGANTPGFIIPTGNLGNALAAIWAKRMGAPISRIHIAVNANRTLADYGETGRYEPRPSVKTLSNAMDVGAPSNFERLSCLLSGATPASAGLSFSAHGDVETANAIKSVFEYSGRIICPHTAVGVAALKAVSAFENDWIVAATAHPAKFNDVIEPILGVAADYPPQLAAILSAPMSVFDVANDYTSLKDLLLSSA